MTSLSPVDPRALLWNVCFLKICHIIKTSPTTSITSPTVVVLDRYGSAEDLHSEKVKRDRCGSTNVGAVDHGVDVADVDDGTNVDDVDDGADVDDVDDGADVDDVDDGAEVDDVNHSTDVDDGSAFQKCFHLNTSPSSIPSIPAATLKKTVTSSSLLVPFILFDVLMFDVLMLCC
ncbi:unnamed protein product [Camellia sinensis]